MKMSSSAQSYPILCKLCSLQKPRLKKVLKICSPHTIDGITEAFLNVRNGNVPIPPNLLPVLRKYKKPFRRASNKNLSVEERRKVFLRHTKGQKGGVFPILPLVLKLALPVISSLIAKKLAG